METRITLFELNQFSHLLNGHTQLYFQMTTQQFEYYAKNMTFLIHFLENYPIYSNQVNHYPQVEAILQNLQPLHTLIMEMPFQSFIRDQKLKRALWTQIRKVGDLLNDYTTKCIILPGIQPTNLNYHLKNISLLKPIKESMPPHALILSLKDFPRIHDLTLYRLLNGLDQALMQYQSWPAILLWQQNDPLFIKFNTLEELESIINHFDHWDELTALYKQQLQSQLTFLLHLSDLHIGSKSAKTNALLEVINHRVITLPHQQIVPLISGDLVDSAKPSYIKQLENYLQSLIDLGLQTPLTVKGNHDVYIRGMFKIPKLLYRFRAYLGKQSYVHVIEEEKIIVISFDSNEGGHLFGADGGISRKQYRKIEAELEKIPNKEQYTKIAMLHHHVVHFPKMRSRYFIKRTFEGYPRFRLNHYERFIDWLNHNDVKIAVHGHRHEQHYGSTGDIQIFASGSSTGKLEMVDEDQKHLYYNLIIFKNKQPTFCFMYYVHSETKAIIRLRMIALTK